MAYLDFLPGGFRYFARWLACNSPLVNVTDLKTYFELNNHVSWGVKAAAERSFEFAAELNLHLARHGGQVGSTQRASCEQTGNGLAEFTTTLGLFLDVKNWRSNSPSLSDFEQTLSTIIEG
ncbi:hypothetical protein BT69DRAFT_1284940 [Atractiella rhizophila]|nr:hypothetical protein BT69DRAFT_1284940 [Atractiella rhizophila]